MEVSRRTTTFIRPAKPGLGKAKSVRAPLAGVENVVNRSSANTVLKDKSQLKPSKEIKKAKVAEKVEQLSRPPVTVPEELIKAFSEQVLPINVKDIDCDDKNNPQLVSQYVNGIYRYMRILEDKYPIKKNFVDAQPEVTGKMRAVLVDWLVQVHLKFHLLQETLYLTIAIIDRFLQAEKVRRSRLQLVGVTAMFIAAKYEEMYAPEVGDFVYITDNTYDKSEILRMEMIILRKLNFSLGKPLPLHFLRRNSKAGDVDATLHTLAKYLMELVLQECDFAHWAPSLVAAAALYLAIKLLDEAPWTETLVFYSGYSEKELLPFVSSLCKLVLKAETSKLQSVRSKYASNKLMKISTIPELNSAYVKTMAEQC